LCAVLAALLLELYLPHLCVGGFLFSVLRVLRNVCLLGDVGADGCVVGGAEEARVLGK